MKAKEFIPASKPRNLVAKNAPTSGAGRHKDSSKKKDIEQGKVKHKKDLVPMEGWSDAYVAQRTGRPRTPYSVYIKGKKWKDFENDDHARAVMDKLKAKFKADGRDPETITIAPTDYDKMSEGTDQVKKVFKDKSGKPVGEIGIDPESSPGNGEWYVHHYTTGYSVVGFDSAAEAKRELLYVHKHPDAVEGHPSTKEQAAAEGESALEKFRKSADEREKKHNDAEKEMKARHASGKEDMKGAIDRLEKQVNNK